MPNYKEIARLKAAGQSNRAVAEALARRDRHTDGHLRIGYADAVAGDEHRDDEGGHFAGRGLLGNHREATLGREKVLDPKGQIVEVAADDEQYDDQQGDDAEYDPLLRRGRRDTQQSGNVRVGKLPALQILVRLLEGRRREVGEQRVVVEGHRLKAWRMVST